MSVCARPGAVEACLAPTFGAGFFGGCLRFDLVLAIAEGKAKTTANKSRYFANNRGSQAYFGRIELNDSPGSME